MLIKGFWAVLIGIILALGIFSVIVARAPSHFAITRSITIAAPAQVVFEKINNFHQWQDWSPWAKLDPQVKNTYEGLDAGVGAIFKWSGNREVGAGQMTIVESQPFTLIGIKLDFTAPMTASNRSQFTLVPEGNDTRVIWTMSGHNHFIARAFGILFNIDKMVGSQFEKGLATLKALSEKTSQS
jgi:hypothetical protein